jgi:hypothetical protein
MRGDPGIFGFLRKAVGSIGGAVSSFLPGPAGAIVRTVSGAIAGKSAPRPAPAQAAAQAAPGGAPLQMTTRTSLGGGLYKREETRYGVTVDPVTGQLCPRKKRRRMNVANPKALRKAIRRAEGFGKLVQRNRKAIKKAARAVG